MPLYRGIGDAPWSASLPTCSRAALVDVAVSLVIAAPFFQLLRRRPSARWPWAAMIGAGAVIAIVMEKGGLLAGRWDYSQRMPLLPWLDVGMMPVVQMALIPCLSARLTLRPRHHASVVSRR